MRTGAQDRTGAGHPASAGTASRRWLGPSSLVLAAMLAACGSDGSQPTPSPPGAVVPPPPAPPPPPPPPPPPAGQAVFIGAQIGPGEAARHCQGVGAVRNEATSLWVRWGEVPRVGSGYDWTRLDAEIDALRGCGLDIALHVQSRRSRGDPEPPDLSQYLPFLSALATRYRGRVSRYSIENEAVAEIQWAGTPETYFALLAAAYPVLKAADPAAIVQESGLSSATLGILRVEELYRAGRINEALALADRVRASFPDSADRPPPPTTVADLEASAASEAQARMRRWIELLRQHRASFDALQIHFYGDWDLLPDTMRWVNAQGIGRPLELWELSERRPRGFSNDAEVADDLAKLITIAVGEGSRYTLFYNHVDWEAPGGYFPGLVDGAGRSRLPIETAFRTLTQWITDAASAAPLDLGPGIWAYRFEMAGTGRLVHVLWSAAPSTVAVPGIGDGPVRLIQLNGAEATASARAVPITAAPVIVVASAG